MTQSAKKRWVIGLTIFVGIVLIAILVLQYTRPAAISGSSEPGEKLKAFFNDAVQTGSSYFAK